MGVKSFARRVRGMLRRNKRTQRDKGKGRETQSDDHNGPEDKPLPEGPVIDHGGYSAAQNGSRQRRIISRTEIQSARQSQEASIFFSKFPLEIRRLIYRQVFANYLKPRRVTSSSPGSDLRLHIYRDDTGQWKLGHTHCKIHPGEPDQEDALATSTLPFGAFTRNDFAPPNWFWLVWVMRLNWGRHWKCQHAIQKRWDPRTGLCKEVATAPFLPLFLTCKSVYDEAITLFFEEVTPIFTSSEDAHRFFIQKPHPYLSSLRTVEFSFCNPNDHLYLSKVWRESLKKIVEEEAADYRAEHGDNDGPPPISLVPNPAVSDKVGTTSCDVETFPIFWEKVNVFGKQLWAELLRGVRTSTALKDLDVTISGKITQRAILAPFGGHEAPALGVEEEAEHEENEEEEREGEEAQQSVARSSVYEIGDDIWQLRGTLAVSFSQDNERFVQRGSKMIRLLPGGQQVEVDGKET